MRSFFLASIQLFIFLFSISFLGQDTFRDNFQSAQYNNNDGNQNFLSDWVETNDGSNPPTNGRILVDNNQLRFRNLDGASITRDIDLSGYVAVTLTLDYERTWGNEMINVLLFDGIRYNSIDLLNGTGSISIPLNPNEINANSSIRFESGSGNWSNWETMYIDNILFTATPLGELPEVTGSGNKGYCPGNSVPIADAISITNSSNNSTDAVYIQISDGYVNGEDVLTLTGSHPSISASWNATQGELTLAGPTTYAAFEAAILDVHFSSSNPAPTGNRQFSITVGEANFLPESGHYYEFVSDVGVTWTDAQIYASNRSYFGLQGYLATLTSLEEAIYSGTQAQGTGWIGASDAAVEGDWRWVTGPEAGTPFWSGAVAGNTVPPTDFAYWNGNEPNNDNDEDYAHITDPSVLNGGAPAGSWNDLPNAGASSGPYQPQGYIIEYGGMPGDPVLSVTVTTLLYMSSCKIITNSRITVRVRNN